MSFKRTTSAETAARFMASYGQRHDLEAEMLSSEEEWRARIPDMAYADLMAVVASGGSVDRVDAVLVMVMHGFDGAAIARRITGVVDDPRKFVRDVFRRNGISGRGRRLDAKRALIKRHTVDARS